MTRSGPTDAHDQPPPGAKRQSLWQLALPPGMWAVHFTLCYVTAAIWCAKVATEGGPLGSARLLIGLYTLVAVPIILLALHRAWRQHRWGNEAPPHDEDTAGERHRFLGFATVLLSLLSLVATLFTALVAVIVENCQ